MSVFSKEIFKNLDLMRFSQCVSTLYILPHFLSYYTMCSSAVCIALVNRKGIDYAERKHSLYIIYSHLEMQTTDQEQGMYIPYFCN